MNVTMVKDTARVEYVWADNKMTTTYLFASGTATVEYDLTETEYADFITDLVESRKADGWTILEDE